MKMNPLCESNLKMANRTRFAALTLNPPKFNRRVKCYLSATVLFDQVKDLPRFGYDNHGELIGYNPFTGKYRVQMQNIYYPYPVCDASEDEFDVAP